jgi:pantetheine-phosphate adenylyltransferase
MNTHGFYAGSFDPPTMGHIYVITKSLELFDKVTIGVGTNPAKIKSYAFTTIERVKLLEQSMAPRDVEAFRVDVFAYSGYLVHAAMDCRCTHIVRGIRNGRDLEDEMMLADMNKRIAITHPSINSKGVPQTVFIPTPADLAHVSSSMVKSLIGFGDWKDQISQFVTEPIYNALVEKYDSQR